MKRLKKKYKTGGPTNKMPLDLPLKEQNPYLVPEYNQPMANGYILPDPNRPKLLPEVNASEYKVSYDTGTPDEIQIPTIVGGQYLGNRALERFNNTGERFKTMKDPASYSKFYDTIDNIGIMQNNYAMGGKLNKLGVKNSLWNNIRASKGSGKKPTKEMLEQEAKIKAEYSMGGRLKKKYALGGRESQIAQTNQNLLMQGNNPQSFGRDMGNLLLDGLTAPLEGLTGAEIFNPEYSTKLGQVGSKVANMAGDISSKVGVSALNMVVPGLGTGIGAAGKAAGEVINAEQSALKFRKGGQLEMIGGPSHEMGGMAITPNAEAEGGETKIDDYIFSDVLKMPKSKSTFASKSKSIHNKFKLRPNDPLSLEAKDKELLALRDTQEAFKQVMTDKYMKKAMKFGGKIGGNPYIAEDSGKIPVNQENNMIFDSNQMEQDPMGIPSIFNQRASEIGLPAAKEEYERFVLGKQQARMGGRVMKYVFGGDTPIGPVMEDGTFATGYPKLKGLNIEQIPFGAEQEVPQMAKANPYFIDESTGPMPYEFNNSLLPLGTNIAGNIAKEAMLLNSNKGRLTPNLNLDNLNAQPAIDIAQQNSNNALAAGFRGIRDNATSSGQAVANANILASTLGANTGSAIADIKQQYDNSNIVINNEENIRNNANTTANNLILDQAEANRINQTAGIIDNQIGAVQQYGKDEQMQNYYNIAANNMLPAGTKIKYVRGKNGKMIPKVVADPNYLANTMKLLSQ
jgi:hypothetical protein